MIVFLAIAILLATEPAPASQTIATDLDERAIVASGLTPGREAVMLTLGRETRGLAGDQLVRYTGGALSDTHGRARFALGRPLSQRSLWVVVDQATGRLAVGTPEGFQASELPSAVDDRTTGELRMEKREPIRRSSREALAGKLAEPVAGGWAAISFRKLASVELVLIRPGEAVWHANVADGSRADADRKHNRKISVRASSLTRLSSGPPASPQAFQAGDRILVIDPLRLIYSLLEPR